MADYRKIPEEDTPLYFSLSSIQEGNKDALLRKLEIVFSSASCVNSCFLSRLVHVCVHTCSGIETRGVRMHALHIHTHTHTLHCTHIHTIIY